jgi:hypothetical protein
LSYQACEFAAGEERPTIIGGLNIPYFVRITGAAAK